MTLLMWSQVPAGFAIVTDTLVTDATDHSPAGFGEKLRPFPHLRLAISGTGSRHFIDTWCRWVAQNFRYRDAAELNVVAPFLLRAFWAEVYTAGGAVGTSKTSTIYHFAIEDGETVSYTYYSIADFEPEVNRLPGAWIKPGPTDGDLSGWESIDDIVDQAVRIQQQQLQLPANRSVRVGGELHLTTLTEEFINIQRIHRFGDFDEFWRLPSPRPALTQLLVDDQ